MVADFCDAPIRHYDGSKMWRQVQKIQKLRYAQECISKISLRAREQFKNCVVRKKRLFNAL